MKRITIMYMVLALLTGCSGQGVGWQTGNVALVRTMGVDRTETGLRISTAADTGGPDGGALWTAEESSVAKAVRRLRGMSGGTLHFGHTEQLVLGEALLQNGAEQVLDFIARDRQIGPGVQLWVLKGALAQRGLACGGSDLAARLEGLVGGGEGAEGKLPCTATRLMSIMARGGSVPVPALRIEEDNLQLEGYAVLHRGRLVGFLDAEQSLGLELLQGEGGGQLVSVELPDGARLVLAVERARVAGDPVFRDGKLTGVKLRCEAQMTVAQGAAMPEPLRRQVTQYAQQVLCDRMSAAVARAQFWGTDYVGLAQMVREVCAEGEWDSEDWVAQFRALSIEVETQTRIVWPADMMEEQNHDG